MRNAVRGLWIAAAVFALANAANADEGPPDFCSTQRGLFDQYLQPKTGKSVGTAVVTFKLGEKPCYFFFGKTETGPSGKAPDANTIFELASITKVFTTAILAERSLQGLDPTKRVKQHLPDDYALTSNEEAVTFQQLATFTGGFYWDTPTDAKGHLASFTDATPPDGPILGEANLPTVNFYSNGSIGLLGQALMHIDSSPGQRYFLDAPGFSRWIADNLTTALDMPHTAVHPGGGKATGYNLSRNAQSDFPFVPWFAAGALRSNIADMLKFLQANICAYHASDPACAGFPADVMAALMTSHAVNSYTPAGALPDATIYLNGVCGSRDVQAWAWRVLEPPSPNTNDEKPIISKDGGHPGFSTWIGFSPDKKYGLVILLNTGGIGLINAGQNMIQNTN
jgi:CubicO group peptidase (beta-lactamase class C family)